MNLQSQRYIKILQPYCVISGDFKRAEKYFTEFLKLRDGDGGISNWVLNTWGNPIEK